jgi:hypothetical protein
VDTIRRRILVLAAAVAFLCPILRSEQPQKASRSTQEDRIKKLEERADAGEKATSAAAMEKDYIERTQKLYESYYQKTFNIQLGTLVIVGLLLTAVFGLVARFSLNLFEQRTKLATADATAQMRNEYVRILTREVQKLWDSNTADARKLKEALTAQIAELELKLKDQSDFQIQFVQGLIAGTEERHDDSVVTFRQALRAYKSGKPRNLMETAAGATTVKFIFESLRKAHGENYLEKAREVLADPLYNGLEEELALAALHIPWLTPLINERTSASPEPPVPEPGAEPRPAAPGSPIRSVESDWLGDEESDSCRLINN